MQIPTTRFRGGLPPRATLWAYPSDDFPNGRRDGATARADQTSYSRRRTTCAASVYLAPAVACVAFAIRRFSPKLARRN